MLQLPPGMKPNLINNMYERHHQMARMLLLGCTLEQVASAVGCSVSHVSNVKRSPIFQDKLQYLHTCADNRAIDAAVSIKTRLAADASANLDLLQDVRDGKLTNDVRLRTHVAQDLLDRAGHGKITKIEGKHAIAHLDSDALERVKELSRQLRDQQSSFDAQAVEEAA